MVMRLAMRPVCQRLGITSTQCTQRSFSLSRAGRPRKVKAYKHAHRAGDLLAATLRDELGLVRSERAAQRQELVGLITARQKELVIQQKLHDRGVYLFAGLCFIYGTVKPLADFLELSAPAQQAQEESR